MSLSLQESFFEHAATAPDSPAVICNGGALSYAELARRADRLASELMHSGCMPECLIGVCVARSLDLAEASRQRHTDPNLDAG